MQPVEDRSQSLKKKPSQVNRKILKCMTQDNFPETYFKKLFETTR